jgi:hypothetical protein
MHNDFYNRLRLLLRKLFDDFQDQRDFQASIKDDKNKTFQEENEGFLIKKIYFKLIQLINFILTFVFEISITLTLSENFGSIQNTSMLS